MILTAQQEKAIQIMGKNVNKKEPVTVISGFAGT